MHQDQRELIRRFPEVAPGDQQGPAVHPRSWRNMVATELPAVLKAMEPLVVGEKGRQGQEAGTTVTARWRWKEKGASTHLA